MTQSGSIGHSEITHFIKLTLSVVIVPGVFSFFMFYTYLFKKYLQNQKVSTIIIYGLYFALISAIIGNLMLYILLDFNLICHRDTNFISTPIIAFISLLFGSVGFIFKGFFTWSKEIKLKEELIEKTHKTEMALVKSQLDPHFLFNTINNIDILILKDPKEASNYLNKLSDIMRFMLFETKTNRIPLNNELRYIEKYIELQKIRTSNTNYVSYFVDGNPQGKYIAPMVFIPFIENAFKHCNNKKLKNAIAIEIGVTNKIITLRCTNKFNLYQKKKSDNHGLGNELIEKRLNLIYPDQHTLHITKTNNEYIVTLSIPNEKI